MSIREPNEPVLGDDYPVFAGYLYVVDGEVVSSHIEGNVKRLKAALKAKEVRRCDIVARGLL
jgi:hypothetical protein